MTARIFKPAKTAMQSGKAKSDTWRLEYEAQSAKSREPLMGYTSSNDMLSQIRMNFDSREEAVDYAERNGIEYRVQEPKTTTRRAMSYSDNFKFDRKVPWTH